MTLASFVTACLLFEAPSLELCMCTFSFSLMQYIMYILFPGNDYKGPEFDLGTRVSYRDNGLLAFLVTSAIVYFSPMVMIAAYWKQIVTLGNILGVVAVLACNYPIQSIQHWYVGKDLHPLDCNNVDWKFFIASRISMMAWGVAALVTALYTPYQPVQLSAILQYVYLFRFFLWESGYVYSMDQQHDRAGFYICWGCLSFVPMMYWLPLLQVPVYETVSWLFLPAGLLAQWLLYDVDRQKHAVKMKTVTTIWGKPPVLLQHPSGSQLLCSGWWGVARHTHYAFELLAALCWCGVVGGLAYAYFVYLAVLLIHRSFRDDDRCKQKYGDTWTEYCTLVPYKIVPYVF